MDRKPRPIVDLTAHCACGAIGITVRGTIRSMLICSCEDCQKASGTGHATVALVAAADVTITGSPKPFSRPANSGATLTRWFCPDCGTPVAAESSRAPGILLLPVGLFGGDTEWYAPSQLIFARSHREWDALSDGIPRYQTYRDEESSH